MSTADAGRATRPSRHAHGFRTPGGAAAALLGLLLCCAGCVFYTAEIHVARDGSVRVVEHLAIDPDWKASIGDTLQAAEQLLNRYRKEARLRGGKVLSASEDSVVMEFHYRTLAAFARAWPDSGDEGQRWDRSLFRRRTEDGRAVDELILWRQGPPDSSQAAKRPNPMFTFWVTPPVPPIHNNAHAVNGAAYGWRFTARMTAPDSVWIVWPATEK
jgi:hypothetical protein